jgi:hypothetical protein
MASGLGLEKALELVSVLELGSVLGSERVVCR